MVTVSRGPFQYGIDGMEFDPEGMSCGLAIVVTPEFVAAAKEVLAELQGGKTLSTCEWSTNEGFLKAAELSGFRNAFSGNAPLRFSKECGLEKIAFDRDGKWLEFFPEETCRQGGVYRTKNLQNDHEVTVLFWSFWYWARIVQSHWEEKQKAGNKA